MSVATASPRTLCPAVGSSRNARKVWVTLPIPVVYVNEDPAEVKHHDVVLAEVSLVLRDLVRILHDHHQGLP